MKKRLLFVDDEPNVLQGLQRMLRPLREEWDMTFVASGAAALAHLVHTPCDVIVSDMRMPGMDGAELLTEVGRRYPEMMRIILSGQAKQEEVLKAVGPTHQYLAKPCDPEILKSIVNRAKVLHELLTDTTLKGLVAGMKSLPTLPSLFLEVTEALKSPDASLQQVSGIIAKDAGMTAKILQLVNSAYFGLRRQVDDLARAVSLLGFDTIKSLVLSLHVFSQGDQNLLRKCSLHTLWSHSFAVGSCARQLARTEKAESQVTDAAFTASLLHDCGKLILASNLPEEYSRAVVLAQDQGLPLWEAEHAIFGASHAEVGAYLLGLWGLPEPIVEALAFHHQPTRCPERNFRPLTVVHVIDVFVHECEGLASKHAAASVDLAYLAAIGLNDRLPVWREQSAALLQQ